MGGGKKRAWKSMREPPPKKAVSIAKKSECRFENRFAKKKTRREGDVDETRKL